ncbi:MAG: hypothetical protein ACOH2N_08365 [Devosia sp.]|jgi:hypothetical protein
MQETTSPKRRSFTVYAIASTGLAGLGAVMAIMAGVSPSYAATLAAQPDTQIAVFMIPLTLLVLALMFEVARFALRGTLPAQQPARRPTRLVWAPGRHEG